MPVDRRTALQALLALPTVGSIARAPAALQPNDVIVIQSEDGLSVDAIRHIEAKVREVWPNHRVLVLDGGMQLKIVAGS